MADINRYNINLNPGSPLYNQYPNHVIKGVLLEGDRSRGILQLEEQYGTRNGWASVQPDGYVSR